MYVSVYVLLYSYMHLYILFVEVKVMSSVKAQWITHLDSNFLSKIVRLSPQSISAGMYTCLYPLVSSHSSLPMAYNLFCTTLNVRV